VAKSSRHGDFVHLIKSGKKIKIASSRKSTLALWKQPHFTVENPPVQNS
jgi:primase-polymerase (primpol)-like protein